MIRRRNPSAERPGPMRASRPHMPGYGLLGPRGGVGLLPWSWAEKRLRSSHNYWLSTVTAAGRPHAMAVWGIWELDAFFFSTGGESRKARNLGGNPSCVVATESAAEAVIVEGVAELVADPGARSGIAERYEAKYSSGYPPDSHVYQVRPEVVFGFIEDESTFAGAATRWQFDRERAGPRGRPRGSTAGAGRKANARR